MTLYSPIYQNTPRVDRASNYFSGTSTDDNALLQNILDDIALNSLSRGKREFVIDCRLNFGDSVRPPDNFSIYFEKNGIIIPQDNTVIGFRNDNNIDGTNGAIYNMFDLASDAEKGDSSIDMGSNSSQFSVGDYIFIKDTAIITTSPNKNNLVQAHTAKVLAKDGNNLILDNAIKYDMSASTTDIAVIGGRHGLKLIGFNYGEMGGQIGNDGCDFRYMDDLIIKDYNVKNSRTEVNYLASSNRVNVQGLNIVGCSNVDVERFSGMSLGYYGINIDSCSRNVSVRKFDGSYMRHGISINWNGYGETYNYNIEDVNGSNMQRGVVDTHDVGNEGTINKVVSDNCLEDGGQVRTSNVVVKNYTSKNCGNNGFVVRHETTGDASKLTNVNMENIFCYDNGKRGIFSSVSIGLSGGICERNGSKLDVNNDPDPSGTIKPDETGGISLNGGYIHDFLIRDNVGTAIMYHDGSSNTLKSNQKPLTVTEVEAPYNSSNQTHFLRSADTYDGEGVRLRNIDAIGYPASNRVSRATSTYYAQIDDESVKWSDDPIEGTIGLVAGQVTVNNANVVQDGSVSSNEWFSQISLGVMDESANTGSLSYSIANGTSFTIKSSNPLSTDRVSWKII